MRSGRHSARTSSASRPLPAVRTSYPSSMSRSRITERTSRSSSTTRIRSPLGMRDLGGVLDRREPDADRHAKTDARAGGLDSAAVALDDLAADIETQPRAGKVRLGTVRPAYERLEDLVRQSPRQPDPLICPSDEPPLVPPLEPDPYLAAFGRI